MMLLELGLGNGFYELKEKKERSRLNPISRSKAKSVPRVSKHMKRREKNICYKPGRMRVTGSGK